MSKDASGFTPQERHQIIVDYLREINKPTKVFHLRWKPGDLLNGSVLDTTPMFWYMKYGWSRAEIEALFYKARVVINDKFDRALQQTFGGDAGARWRGAIPETPKQKWRELQAEKTISWKAEQAEKIKRREEMERVRRLQVAQKAAETERLRKEEEKTLTFKGNDIWNAVSDFGADKSIDYMTFSENLKDRGINVSPLLAKQLFDQVARNGNGSMNGKLTKQQMDELLNKLDAMADASTITWDMLGDKLGCMTIMKRVLLAAGAGEPFNVDDFVFAQKFSFTIDTIQFMNKLTDRDVEWDDRVRAMEELGANLGTNPMFNDVLARGNIPELLCGWATQILDTKPEVQKTAIDTLPGVFHNAMQFGDKDIAVGHLDELLDNLFKVLDDPNSSRNHPAAEDAIDKLVNDVVENADPESVLFLSGLLAEKTDIANISRPEARKFALAQLQKIMFGANSPYIKFDEKKKDAPIVSLNNLPARGTVHREWLDIGTKKQSGPSPAMIQKKIGMKHAPDNPHINPSKAHEDQPGVLPPSSQENDGVLPDEDMYGFQPPERNKASSRTSPRNAFNNLGDPPPSRRRKGKVKDITLRWAGNPREPQEYHDSQEYANKGKTYPDNQRRDETKQEVPFGSEQESFSSESVIPKTDPADPYAHLTANPLIAKVNEPIDFDASKSHDCDHQPCVSYTFDFGDDTPNVTSDRPIVPHDYAQPGTYPVTVTVCDKYGKTGTASCTQRVVDPNQADTIGPPCAQLSSDPTESKVNQLVYFDASESHDFENNPCEHFVFDFGDGSRLLHSKVPKVTHPYKKRGVYPVTVLVTDKWGQTAQAAVQQRVIDPNMQDPTEPYAHLSSEPTQAKTNEPVTFDASRSVDCDGLPVKKYIFDFGDGSKPVTSFKPIVTHPFKRGGTYPVTLTVQDKYGKTATAQLSQCVKDPFNPTKRAPPYAAVRSTPPDADIDEPVTFDASKSHDYLGDPCEMFVWDFGDGSPKKTSTTPIVQHAYAEAGTYPVTVQVTDQYGQTSPAKCNQRVSPPEPYVTKNQAEKIHDPYVTVESTPSNAKVNEPVTFDASKSHDMDHAPLKEYEWDFGDGTPKVTTSGPIVKHKYAEAGSYPVKVIGTDKYDRKGDAKLNQLVHDPKHPNAPLPPYAHVISDPSIAQVKQPVAFDASKSHDQFDKPCVQFVWDFGDGSPKVTTPGPNTTHPYQHPGTYPVKVTVTDKNGLSAQAGLNQKVIQDGPSIEDPYVALASTPSDPKPKEPVLFDASTSHDMDGDPCKTFTWDFGDGSPKKTTTVPIVNHAYDEPGSYPVTVSAVDKYGRNGDAALTQNVIDPNHPDTLVPPYAALKSTPPEAAVHQPVHFDASDSHDMDGDPCVKFLWDFGDGSPKETTDEPYIDHPYKKAGVYPVTVEVTDKNGLKGNAKINQRVRESKPEDPYAALQSTPPIAKPQQQVTFDASRSMDCDSEPCKQFVFDFGDGSPAVTSSDPTVNHAYKEPGSYPVTCTVTDKYGNKGNATLQQKVDDPLSPSYNVGNEAVTDSDSLEEKSNQKGKQYPDNRREDEIKKDVPSGSSEDYMEPPYAALCTAPPESVPRQNVLCDASKSKDYRGNPCVKFLWDFGDDTPNQTTTTPTVLHPFEKAGTYPVSVVVTDKDGLKGRAQCNQRVRQTQIEDPFAHVSNDPEYAKPGEPVTFDSSKSHDMDGDPCKTFVWDYGDGTPLETTSTPSTKHVYNEPGSYPVHVTVIDKYKRKGNAHVTQQVIDPEEKEAPPPIAHLESDPPQSKPQQPVTFDASKSHDYNGDPCVKFLWDFGDGTPQETTDVPQIRHPYAKPSTYPVSVVVTDRNGKTATAGINQRVSDPAVFDTDPSGAGAPKNTTYPRKRGQRTDEDPDAVNAFTAHGGNDKPNALNNEPPIDEYKNVPPGMNPDEIGDEFRNITHDAISNAILDPNLKNNRDAKKFADIMTQLNPAFKDELDPEAKRQFGKWKKKPLKPTGPYRKKLPSRPLPTPAVQRLHHVETTIHVDVGKPIMPDI